ncbi:MAG: pyrroline-5-carboxylate reductase [Flavobacteriaceae bacterium]|nr:MAG: pyrroline-5-carboxylate reductase [Flavobacteriaceae bacterium]
MKKIAIIGSGNIGSAIVNGIIKTQLLPAANIHVSDKETSKLEAFKKQGLKTFSDNIQAIEGADVIVLALKPWFILDTVNELKPFLDIKKQVLVSTATLISLSEIQAALGSSMPIFRVMPNTAAAVGESLTFICALNDSGKHRMFVSEIFQVVGKTMFIDENQLNAATALSASGIAYFFRFIQAMGQGGVQVGFDAQTAQQIILQTAKGAIELLEQNQSHPGVETDKVTTPKGSTITALNKMEEKGLSASIILGIVAAYEKLENK